MTSKPVKPKRTVNRVMIDPRKDDFYGGNYKVLETTSLTFFDPSANSNKFYVAEIHEAEGSYNGKRYRLFINHGRIGANGQSKAEPFDDLTTATKKYNTKVREKIRKGYKAQDVAVQAVGSKQAQRQVNTKLVKGVAKQQSSLHPKVADLVETLYKETNQAVSVSLTGSVKSNVQSPIGSLGLNGIQAGRRILTEISNHLQMGAPSGVIEQLSIQYYKTIPRKLPTDVRKDTSWILSTQKRLSKEFDILDLYEDTLRVLPMMANSTVDAQYHALNTAIRLVEETETLEYLRHKVVSTQAPNHNYKLELVEAYEIQQKNAPPFNAGVGNVVHLFHGSRTANLVGILSSHLKLPQHLASNIQKTGAMFGAGIYFAHNSTKSFNYSKGSFVGRGLADRPVYLFVAEVAMGNVYKTDSPYPFVKPPQGYHSVMGVKGTHLVNNEFIVYDPSQVRLKYLLQVKMV